MAAYRERSQRGDCFICEIVQGEASAPSHIVYRDDYALAFLNLYPTLLGYCLVAPLEHRIHAIDDFSLEDYVRLQRIVHKVGSAISRTVPTERLYVLSLGSNTGNAHVHWHLAPLPPGVPYEEQQLRALMAATRGVLDLSPAEREELANSIRANLQ